MTPRRPSRPNRGPSGGGRTRPSGGPSQVGGVSRGIPDLNGAQRGLGYSGLYNQKGIGGMPTPPQPSGFAVPQQFMGAYNQGTSMEQTARNEYLNTLPVGGQREMAMNAMGYWNGGVPFVPQAGGGINRFHRENAAANPETGGYSAPGMYQHMDAGNRGYVGFTDVSQDGSAQYTPFATRGRIRRRGGTTGGYIL